MNEFGGSGGSRGGDCRDRRRALLAGPGGGGSLGGIVSGETDLLRVCSTDGGGSLGGIVSGETDLLRVCSTDGGGGGERRGLLGSVLFWLIVSTTCSSSSSLIASGIDMGGGE